MMNYFLGIVLVLFLIWLNSKTHSDMKEIKELLAQIADKTNERVDLGKIESKLEDIVAELGELSGLRDDIKNLDGTMQDVANNTSPPDNSEYLS